MSVPYVVNGKVYTSYPLMDEIVYNCKLILNGIVVKNEYVAHQYETEETLQDQEYLFKCKAGTMNFDSMPYTVDMLIAYGYDESIVNQYIADPNLIPIEDRDSLLTFSMQYYIDNYEEKNKYYRSLMGLPEYGTTKYNVYITESDLPPDFDMSLVDFSLPLHEQSSLVISALKSNGRLNEIIETNRSFNYSYLRFLDDLSLDVYTCRKAGKWDILYMPDANSLVISRFQEIYNINKQMYLKNAYQLAYAFRSEYYDHLLIFIVLCQTLTDMVGDTTEWFIRKDIFDIRTVEFFLESYGVPFFDEIPLKYQIKIVKNLNKLIKYKSTLQNFEDIMDIFRLKETHIYTYYLYKRRRLDQDGKYVESPDLNKMYELIFVETLLGDSYDSYIKNSNHRIPYNTITMNDEYWDGVDDHEKVKQQILEKDFTIEPTKYLTLKAEVDYLEYQRQLIYMLNLILDSRSDMDDLTIGCPSISDGESFRISNLMIFAFLINNLTSDISQEIIRPEDTWEEKTQYIPDYDPSAEPHSLGPDDGFSDWWLREIFPECFIRYENRVFGFNPEADLNAISEVLSRGYSNFSLKNYTLADFGCDNFIVPNYEVTSFEELCDIYENNMNCYTTLNSIISHSCQDEFQQLLARYVYTQLFTKTFDYNMYNGYTYLDQVLKDRDYILWSFYKKLVDTTDKETRDKDIAQLLNEIILSLEYYFDRDSLDYFFNFISTNDFSSITRYIYIMANLFKSYKAHFIEPTIKYRFLYPDVVAGNYMEMNDTIFNRMLYYSKFDKEYIHDKMSKTIIRGISDDVRERYVEILNMYDRFEPDPDDNYDYDGGGPDTKESDYTKDIDGSSVVMMLPYKTSDGGFPYGRHGITKYQLNGKDEFILNLEEQKPLEINGGDISEDDNSIFCSNDFYFFKNFTRMHDGNTPATQYIVNNNFFRRLYDYQDHQEMLIAGRTGMEYSEDKETGTAYLKEIWREWFTVTEFEAVKGDPDFYRYLVENDLFEDYYNNFMEHINDGTTAFLDELDQKKNHGIGLDLTLSDIDAEENRNVPWDWDFGDTDDENSGNPLLSISNYENEELDEYNFGETRITSEYSNVHHDYNFGDISYSNILWIEDLYNYDTPRIISYKLV